MPYKFETDKKKIPREYDRRVKLTDEQRDEIRRSELGYRPLGRMYGVDRKLIRMIKDPEYKQKIVEQFKRRQKDGRYYKKELHREQMKGHRRYKKRLMDENVLWG